MTEVAGLTASVQPVGASADVARIVLAGRSDPLGVQRLQQVVDAEVGQGRIRLLVDCRQLEYVNSTAIGYLINLADRLNAAEGKLALVHVSPAVRKVFEVLGLKDYFPTFSNDGEALGHLTKGATRAPAPPSPKPPAPAPAPPPAPAPGSPLDPLRWLVFLRAVAEKVDAAVIPGLCRRLNLSGDGGTLQAARQVLGRVHSPEEFLRLLDSRALAAACGLYGLPAEGSPTTLVERIVAHVRKSSSAQLSKALEAPASEAADLPLELSRENLINLLQHTAPPRRGVPKAVARRLAQAFGRDKVRTRRPAGKWAWAEVDLEVDGRFGILFADPKVLLKRGSKAARGIQALAGRLAVAARHYGKGNALALLVGKVAATQGPLLEELCGVSDAVGAEAVVLGSGNC